MRIYWLLFFVFVVLLYRALGLPSLKIVNGTTAKIGDAPYAVSLRYRNCHQCGGSIITNKWVLTAAHCIYPYALNIASILYGSLDSYNCIQHTEGIRNVKRAIQHPKYENYSGYLNDIALIEVEEHFNFDIFTHPVVLPWQNQATPFEETSLLVGWGYPYDNGTVPEYLQKVDIVIYPDSLCEDLFTTNFSIVSHICAGGWGRGQCSGDSGGALTVQGIQYGIVSWSNKPCASSPGVLTRVASFRDWIELYVIF